MAVVKKLAKKKMAIVKKKTITTLDLSLPTEKSVPEVDIAVYTNLIFGKKKIGKTTLTSHFPEAFHFMFEPGSKALSIYDRMVPTWEHFLGYIALLEEGNHKFKNAIIDTGAIAYDRCLEFICKKDGINHPSDKKDYGATWKKVSQEFERAHFRIISSGLGLIVIAHEKTEEIETRSGDKFDQIVPALSKQADEYYAGTIDNIFYYHFVGGQRFLTIRGDEFIVAGTRCEKNFLNQDGEQIYKIPMGTSSEEAYNNLVAAFNNKQVKTYKPLTERKEEETKVTVKLKKRS